MRKVAEKQAQPSRILQGKSVPLDGIALLGIF